MQEILSVVNVFVVDCRIIIAIGTQRNGELGSAPHIARDELAAEQ
jgi:hypothetical protein